MRIGAALSVAISLGSLGVLGTLSPAAAEEVFDGTRPKGSYIQVPPAEPGTAELHSSSIIYLNRCAGGCRISYGIPEDSRTNKSSIIDGTVTVREFNAGNSAWNAVVECVRDMYEPFGVEITDQDPGNVSHFEAMVAGYPQDIGADSNVGGVSPFSCGIINNAITYSFANIYQGSVQDICEVVAQETAHAFGLDHEAYCPDPMTYDYGCGAKQFRDYNAPCGEYESSPRQCACGGSTQNSYQKILSIFGPGTPTPPTVSITEPADGATVEAGFVVRANATDDNTVTRVDLYVNNQLAQTLTQSPWAFNAPATLSNGIQQVEVRAFDNYNTAGSATIQVVLGAPCGGPEDCGTDEICIEGRCVVGPDGPGGLGTPCTDGSECASNQCANDGVDSVCVEQCESQCPTGFGCLEAGDSSVCWPGAENPDPGGCCSANGAAGSVPGALVVFLGAMLLRRRRRA